jgi:hypothetical protein
VYELSICEVTVVDWFFSTRAVSAEQIDQAIRGR